MRCHHRFRAGVAEGHALVAGHLGEQLGDLAGKRLCGPMAKPLSSCSLTASTTKSGAWPNAVWPIAVDQIDVFVAVDVPDARAARAVADRGINDLLPLRAKAGRGPRIRERRPRCNRALLGASRLRRQTRGERVDVSPLRWGNGAGLGADPIRLESRRSRLGLGYGRRRCRMLRFRSRPNRWTQSSGPHDAV